MKGDYDRAEEQYRSVLSAGPCCFVVRNSLADSLFKGKGDHVAAEKEYRTVLMYENALMNLPYVLQCKGDKKQATRDAIREAIRIHPDLKKVFAASNTSATSISCRSRSTGTSTSTGSELPEVVNVETVVQAAVEE